MSELVEWLTGCYDRAEQRARAAAPGPWEYQDIDSVGGGRVCDPTVAIAEVNFDVDRVDARIRRSVFEEEADATGEHIAAHDPSWRLADIARKRLILAEHDIEHPGTSYQYCRVCHDYTKHDAMSAPCLTLRLLAEEFAGEPGWQEEWRT